MRMRVLLLAASLSFVQCAHAASLSPTLSRATTSDERERSDAFAQHLIDLVARHEHDCVVGPIDPDAAAAIRDSPIASRDVAARDYRHAEAHFSALKTRESNRTVRLDLEVLLDVASYRRRACEGPHRSRESKEGAPERTEQRREAALAFALEGWGIDAAPRRLAADARLAFKEIQRRAQAVAARVANERGLVERDYRDVLKVLKKEQVPTSELVARYKQRQAEIEGVLRKANIVSLPANELRVRLGSREESARMPAPRYDPPPLFGNAQEPGSFVIPILTDRTSDATFDDFGFDEGMWWLTAHEGRPGHDLHYAMMLEHRTSRARGDLAMSTATIEGWGLYAESLVEPLAPIAAQLAILQARLMRAAHAFLDIELNLGLIGEDEVRRVMVEEVGFSKAWADACIRRYKVILPGHAPSYFYGYTEIVKLRHDAEQKLGSRFDVKAFHDAVLAQGLLPLKLLRVAILSEK